MTKDSFLLIQGFCDVSRETMQKFEVYHDLLAKWNKRINLIGPSTEPFIWERHIADGAQLYSYIGTTDICLTDFGSGGGVPGIILAILGIKEVHLVESITKKCGFLREVKRLCQLDNLHVHESRIEDLEHWDNDVITARAFAEIEKILDFSYPFLKKDGMCLLLKGRQVQTELEDARQHWNMKAECYPSRITYDKNSGYVVKIEEISSKNEPTN